MANIGSMAGSVADWFKNLDPEAQQALISGGFQAGGAFFQGRAQGQEAAANREQNQATSMAGLERGFLDDARQGATTVLGQTRMGEIPSTYGNLAMRRALFESLGTGKNIGNLVGINAPAEFAKHMPSFSGPSLDGVREQAMKHFSDPALMADLERRLSAEGRVDPNAAAFDMTSQFGSSAQPYMDRVAQTKDQTNQFVNNAQDRTRQALMGSLQGQQAQGGQQAGKQKGTPWWKKALGIGLGAAGLIAAPFTGGVSTALIGAGGALAGSKLMGGSNQQALMAALGGATSGLGGGKTTAAQLAARATPQAIQQFAGNYAPQNPLRNVRFGGG